MWLPLLPGQMEPGGGALQVAGLLGANTEVREGDQFPANCRQCACGAYEGSVGASAFQTLPLNRAGGMKRGAEAPCEELVSYFK